MIAAFAYLTVLVMLALVVLAVCADARARAGGQPRHAKARSDGAGRVELLDRRPPGELQDPAGLDDDPDLHPWVGPA